LKLNAQAICLLTQSLSPNIEALIIKEHVFPMDAHLLWIYIKDMFSDTTAGQDSTGAGCLIKLVGKTDQTGLTTSTGSRLQKRKHHRSNQNSTSHTSHLSSASHRKCLMAKGKKRSQRRMRGKKKKKNTILILTS
jgi:hypothetical protein